jgi:hypothetical protein
MRTVLWMLSNFVEDRLEAYGVQKVIANEEVWSRVARTVDIVHRLGGDYGFIAEELDDQLSDVVVEGNLPGTFWLAPRPETRSARSERYQSGRGMVAIAKKHNEPRFRPGSSLRGRWCDDAPLYKEEFMFQMDVEQFVLAGLHAFVWTRAARHGLEAAVGDERIRDRIDAYFRYILTRPVAADMQRDGSMIALELTRHLCPILKVVWDKLTAEWHITAADPVDVVGPVYRTPQAREQRDERIRARKERAEKMRGGATLN